MNKYINKRTIWIGLGVIIIFVLGSALDAYATTWSDPVSKSFKKLYPAFFVGARPYSIEDSDEFVNLARKMDSKTSAAAAFDNYVRHAKAEVLAKKLDVKFSSDDVSDELNFYMKGSQEVFADFLNTYFDGRQKLFEQNVVRPAVVESKLRIKYNSDTGANNESYARAQEVLSKLAAGQKFEDLARQYSDDKQSAQLGGDLGFFGHGEILPELEDAIAISKTGEYHNQIIVTRDGYEIIYPVEMAQTDGVKKWHAKHILIQTTGFDDWLAGQIGSMNAKLLKKY